MRRGRGGGWTRRAAFGVACVFDGFYSLDEAGWRRLRSHPSQLRLDGSEPVSFWMETEDTDIRVVSVSLRYDF